MEMVTLKPCPFCGMEMEATTVGNHPLTWFKHPRHPEPDTCILEDYYFYKVAAWNNQTVIDRLKRQIEWQSKAIYK